MDSNGFGQSGSRISIPGKTGDHRGDIVITPNMLTGDANGDGVVSAGDYASVQTNFGSTGAPSYLVGDANGDGVVSAGDYASVQANFGNTSAATQLEEPINATASEFVLVTAEPAIKPANESASQGLPALKMRKYKEIKPVAGFMSNAEYRNVKPRLSNQFFTSSFGKSKGYLSKSIALSPIIPSLSLGQKFINSTLGTFSSPLVASPVIDPQPILLSSNHPGPI